MTDTKRTVGNLILFGGAVFLSGWVGLLTDRLTGQPAPTSLNDYLTGGELPRLVLPLLTVVALRAVVGGWRDAGFAPNLRGAGATYLLLILAYPTPWWSRLSLASWPMPSAFRRFTPPSTWRLWHETSRGCWSPAW